jgi:hypothetical protein
MIVSVRELTAYMDRSLTNRQQDAAELVLAGAQAEVETFLSRPVEVNEFVYTYVIPEDNLWVNTESYFYDRTLDTANSIVPVLRPPFQLHLPNAPIVDVESVFVYAFNGAAGTPPLELQPNDHYLVRKWGLDIYSVWSGDKIVITYNAGMAPNAHVKQVILRMAAREMQNMTDDVVGLKDFQNRAATIAEVGLTEAEKRNLDPLRRKQI